MLKFFALAMFIVIAGLAPGHSAKADAISDCVMMTNEVQSIAHLIEHAKYSVDSDVNTKGCTKRGTSYIWEKLEKFATVYKRVVCPNGASMEYFRKKLDNATRSLDEIIASSKCKD